MAEETEGPQQAEDWLGDEEKTCAYWLGELDRSEKAFKDWDQRCDKIVKRYRDERDRAKEGARKFNVLWSNIQTLKPAIYSRLPKPVIERRFLERNDAERVAGMALERATCVELETGGFDDAIGGKQSAVIDYLLCGRGQIRIRYEAEFEEDHAESVESADDPEEDEASEEIEQSETSLPEVTSERLCVDYVQRRDFRHDPSRTWPEVRWVAFRIWLQKDEAREKFGKEKADKAQYINVAAKEEQQDERDRRPVERRAQFWQIWDRPRRMVWVICPDVTDTVFHQQKDPLELRDFYPCPKPLYATMTPDTLIPVPDYIEYQDQAEDLDALSERMALIESAIQVRGFYDASMPEMAQLLQNRAENKLIPIENWAAFVEKGGFEKTISLMPLDMLVAAYQSLQEAFDQQLKRLYEVTGIADIIRGNTDPDETATAQQKKSNFATLRLKDRQRDVAFFCRDIIRIMVELIATKFSPETIAAMTGLADQNSQDAQFFQQAMQLVSDARMRSFRVDIENQSTVELDAQETRQAATEFIEGVGSFIQSAGQAAMQMPQLRPLLGQILLWGVRQYRTGREIEGAFEQFVDELTQQAKQPQLQPPDPKVMETQAKMQIAAAQIQQKDRENAQQNQQDMHRVQLEHSKMQGEAQLSREKAQNDIVVEREKIHGQMQLEKYKADLEHQRETMRIQHEKEHMDKQHALAEKTLGHEVAKGHADRESKESIEREKMASSEKVEGAKMAHTHDLKHAEMKHGEKVERMKAGDTPERQDRFEKISGALLDAIKAKRNKSKH